MNKYQMFTTMFCAMLAAIVVATPVGCTINRQNQIADAIKAGGDPIAVKCAIEGDTQNNAMCIVAASGRSMDAVQAKCLADSEYARVNTGVCTNAMIRDRR